MGARNRVKRRTREREREIEKRKTTTEGTGKKKKKTTNVEPSANACGRTAALLDRAGCEAKRNDSELDGPKKKAEQTIPIGCLFNLCAGLSAKRPLTKFPTKRYET